MMPVPAPFTLAPNPRVVRRFLTKISVSGDCWEWTGTHRRKGYGWFDKSSSHRLAYEWARGPIPSGLQLDHLCRNHGCVNPLHLEPVTNRENTLRGVGLPAINARKTACVHGHDFTAENTMYRKNGDRVCRACTRINCARQRARYGDRMNARKRELRALKYPPAPPTRRCVCGWFMTRDAVVPCARCVRGITTPQPAPETEGGSR